MSANRMLVELVEGGLAAQEREFYSLAERFLNVYRQKRDR